MRAINELYEALCDVRMYVCMCQRVSVNYGLPVKVFVFCSLNGVGKYGFKEYKYRKKTSKLHDLSTMYKVFFFFFFFINGVGKYGFKDP